MASESPRDRVINAVPLWPRVISYEDLYMQSNYGGPRDVFDSLLANLVRSNQIKRFPGGFSQRRLRYTPKLRVVEQPPAPAIPKKVVCLAARRESVRKKTTRTHDDEQNHTLLQRADEALFEHYKCQRAMLVDTLHDIHRVSTESTVHKLVDTGLRQAGEVVARKSKPRNPCTYKTPGRDYILKRLSLRVRTDLCAQCRLSECDTGSDDCLVWQEVSKRRRARYSGDGGKHRARRYYQKNREEILMKAKLRSLRGDER